MSVTIASHIENNYLLITAAGRVADYDEFKELIMRYYEEIVRFGVDKVIVEEREVQFPLSLLEATESIEFISGSLPEDVKLWRIAFIVGNDIRGIADYWEFQANQNGYSFKVCSAMEEAREFLSG